MKIRSKAAEFLRSRYPDGTSPLKALVVVAACVVLARVLLSLAP